MARSQTPAHMQVRSARMLNVDKGELVPGNLLVEGDRIARGRSTPRPGRHDRHRPRRRDPASRLMDMEVNLLLGGPDHRSPLTAVQDDPAVRTLRAVANARRTLRAGFTTVRNLGLFIQTGGLLLDVALKKAIDLGLDRRARGSCRPVMPSRRPAATSTPPCSRPSRPHIMPLTVEEGIANGVSEVRKAVRYQIKYGAQVIKVCASGGVMSHTGPAGAQQYSDEELRAIVDEAHRAGLKVAAHAHGDRGSAPPSKPASTASSTGR